MEQHIQFCTASDGTRIAYATAGSGPPILKSANWLNHLEHDWKSPIWKHLMEEFSRDQQLIRYDERGNGLSDWKADDLSFEALVSDMESVVDALDLDHFPLLGISQGGAVAIAYALRHPEKVSHLILFGAFARGWNHPESPPEIIEKRKAERSMIKLGWGQKNPAFRQIFTTLSIPDAPSEATNWFNDMQRVSTSPENAARLFDSFGKIDVVDMLAEVKVPTLVLHCREDALVPFGEGRRIASQIPGARFVPLDSRNHLLLKHEPSWERFVSEVRRFIGRDSDVQTAQTLQLEFKMCPACKRVYQDAGLVYCLDDGSRLQPSSGARGDADEDSTVIFTREP